jgi:hypothetical protein
MDGARLKTVMRMEIGTKKATKGNFLGARVNYFINLFYFADQYTAGDHDVSLCDEGERPIRSGNLYFETAIS